MGSLQQFCIVCGFPSLGFLKDKKSWESLVTKRCSAHVKVAVVCILCLMGCALNWHPDNIPYRRGKAEGGHGGDCLASRPEIEDAKAGHSEKKGNGHAKHQESHL